MKSIRRSVIGVALAAIFAFGVAVTTPVSAWCGGTNSAGPCKAEPTEPDESLAEAILVDARLALDVARLIVAL